MERDLLGPGRKGWRGSKGSYGVRGWGFPVLGRPHAPWDVPAAAPPGGGGGGGRPPVRVPFSDRKCARPGRRRGTTVSTNPV